MRLNIPTPPHLPSRTAAGGGAANPLSKAFGGGLRRVGASRGLNDRYRLSAPVGGIRRRGGIREINLVYETLEPAPLGYSDGEDAGCCPDDEESGCSCGKICGRLGSSSGSEISFMSQRSDLSDDVASVQVPAESEYSGLVTSVPPSSSTPSSLTGVDSRDTADMSTGPSGSSPSEPAGDSLTRVFATDDSSGGINTGRNDDRDATTPSNGSAPRLGSSPLRLNLSAFAPMEFGSMVVPGVGESSSEDEFVSFEGSPQWNLFGDHAGGAGSWVDESGEIDPDETWVLRGVIPADLPRRTTRTVGPSTDTETEDKVSEAELSEGDVWRTPAEPGTSAPAAAVEEGSAEGESSEDEVWTTPVSPGTSLPAEADDEQEPEGVDAPEGEVWEAPALPGTPVPAEASGEESEETLVSMGPGPVGTDGRVTPEFLTREPVDTEFFAPAEEEASALPVAGPSRRQFRLGRPPRQPLHGQNWYVWQFRATAGDVWGIPAADGEHELADYWAFEIRHGVAGGAEAPYENRLPPHEADFFQ